MNGRVFPFARQGHDEAQRMLPWLLNGTLDADDRDWVQRHVEGCEECRQALQEMQAIRSAGVAAAAPPGDVDAGWQRMRGRLAQERAGRPAMTGAAPPMRRYAWPRWFIAALGVQAVLLIGLGVLMLRPPSWHTYRALGAAPAVAGMQGNLVVVFEPQLAESQMRRLLAASGARIVDGPNEAGAYVLAVPSARVESVRDALRSAPGVVMVEGLSGDRGPPP